MANGKLGESTPDAIISVSSSSSIIIDMSAYHKPNAFGMILNPSTITVTFPHMDKTVTGHLEQPNTIRWSFPQDAVWTKTIDVARKLEGFWNSGEGPPRAKISVSSSSITINMSNFGRPTAHGAILDASTITVNFPDDRSYTGKLNQPGKINWSNGTVWKMVIVEG